VPVRLLPAAVCALGAHALLYGTFRPGDGVHGYFVWYEPGLAIVSLAAVLLLQPSWLKTPRPVGETARRLSTTALVVLLAQESLERSFQAGHPAFAMLTPSQWLVLLAGIGATALVLALALRAGHAVVSFLNRPPAARTVALARWSVVVDPGRPSRPLAERFALRAPPLAA
jgi:hypothetical protein